MSHEIRTPLSGILGFTEVLGESELTDDQRQIVEVISRSADTLMVVINDILDWSKMEADRMDLDPQPTRLAVLAHDLVQMSRFAVSRDGVEVHSQLDPDLPALVQVDGHRLRQVLHNLLTNAVKFTERGQILLSMHAQHRGTDRCAVRFAIVDSGIGIPEAALGKLFQPFSQADSSHSRSYGGTGLGLAICKRLVGVFGGELEVTSEVGVGSTFTFELNLPLSQPADIAPPGRPTSDPTASDARAANTACLRVLAADDTEVNRLLLQRVLDRIGADYEIVSDGRAAVETYAANPGAFDLILMDCQMPVMDGLEAVERIRSMEPVSQRIPIVALTANATAADRDACLKAGMDDFVAKPTRLAALRETIAKWAPLRAPVSPT